MTKQLHISMLAVVAILRGAFFAQAGQTEASQSHTAWVIESLKRMETIQPGMTRKKLLTVFKTEGGLSTALRRTFVSQDCPYFKVDVEFKAFDQRQSDKAGRSLLVEGDQDLIVKISRPYLQFSIMD